MSVASLAGRLEELRAQFSEQDFNREVGLSYDEELMKKVSGEMTQVCLQFLKEFKEPRKMFLGAVKRIVDAEKLEISLRIHEERLAKICHEKYQVDGRKLNWSTWRQFNASEMDSSKRKEVFDDFLKKAEALSNLFAERFAIAKRTYENHGLNVLDMYLELEGFSYEELHSLLMKLGMGAREAWLEAAEHYAPEVLGKGKVEYYDDFYTWGTRIFKDLDRHFEGVNLLDIALKHLRRLGFDASRIKVDAEEREKKNPSAFCYGIRVPGDVRISYKKEKPFTDLAALLHEFGHGIHGISADPSDPYWKRYVVAAGVAETFSILNESMVDTPAFLQELGLGKRQVAEVIDRRKFLELTFLTFYAANSIMKLEFWKNNYTMAKATERWQELSAKFYLEVPGQYWLLHHVMPEDELYSPSYVIAALRVDAIRRHFMEKYGPGWWKRREAGREIGTLAKQRGDFDVHAWKLDPDSYLEDRTSLNFL